MSTNFSRREASHTCILGQQSLFQDGYYFSHGRETPGVISFMGGKSDINGNPKVAYFNKYFSESEAFSTTIVGQQSSLKEGFHFIHGRGTPL